jgi:hypothetical protein
MLSFLRVWAVRLMSNFTRYFKPVAPELPLSTLDLRFSNAVEIPSVPEDGRSSSFYTLLNSHRRC